MIVVRRRQVPCLLGCRYLVYSAAASGESGKIHNNVRARWEAGETEAVDSMLKFARAAALSSMPHGAACAVYPTSGHGQTSEASPNQISKHQASLTKEASPPPEIYAKIIAVDQSTVSADGVKVGIEFTWLPEEAKALFDEKRSAVKPSDG